MDPRKVPARLGSVDAKVLTGFFFMKTWHCLFLPGSFCISVQCFWSYWQKIPHHLGIDCLKENPYVNCSLVCLCQKTDRDLPKANKYHLSNFSKHVGRCIMLHFYGSFLLFFSGLMPAASLLELQTFSPGKKAYSKCVSSFDRRYQPILSDPIWYPDIVSASWWYRPSCHVLYFTDRLFCQTRCQSVRHVTPTVHGTHWFTRTEKQQRCLIHRGGVLYGCRVRFLLLFSQQYQKQFGDTCCTVESSN